MSNSGAFKQYDDYFDSEAKMIQVLFHNPGYHSRVETGTPVHETRSSLDFALELFLRDDAASNTRACSILEGVAPLLDADPVSKTYGICSWLLEEPLAAMAPPDWNWADFCGLRYGQVLLIAESRLPAELAHKVREALFHCAGSIYRRNMGPHYTNISIMGGIVCTLAAEVLGERRMLDYGLRRLRQAVDHFKEHGGFGEYNSPTYTLVVLWDTAQAMEYLKTPEALEYTRFLFEEAWSVVARHFHPATGQWAGPQSRDYHVFMLGELAEYLRLKTGAPVRTHPLAEYKNFYTRLHFTAEGPGCPPSLRERFVWLPEREYEFRERFIRREPEENSVWGTTWMQEEVCLGSVNQDFMWDQRRAVLAFWNGAADTAVALRLRFLHDHREFASVYVRNVQEGPRVLSALNLLLGRGDFHPEWGSPAGDIFSAEDFRLRYELTGQEVEGMAVPGGFVLRSGAWEACLSPAPGTFGDVPVVWEITRGEGWVALDGVCYAGPRRDFAFRELSPVVLGVGMSLRRPGEQEVLPVAAILGSRSTVFHYGGLSTEAPNRPVPYQS